MLSGEFGLCSFALSFVYLFFYGSGNHGLIFVFVCFQGHYSYHHRKLLHQLLCWICYILNPGSHGIQEGRSCGRSGRYR